MSFLSTLKNLFGFSSKTSVLVPGDRMLICEDCHSQFVFDAGEQRFFKEKGFTDPKRCPRCRKKVRFRMHRRGGGWGSGHQTHNQNQSNRGGNENQQRGQRFPRRRSAIDGDSPYVDER